MRTIVYQGTKLSYIEVPTIVYRGTEALENKYTHLLKYTIKAIKTRNRPYRILSDRLSYIKVPSYRISRYQAIVYQGTKLSYIKVPTIVYQGTEALENKYTHLLKYTIKAIKTRNRPYRILSDRLSYIEVPSYRISRYQAIVYRGTKLSYIEVPTIVYRGTDYRISRYQVTLVTLLMPGDAGTYPQAANLYLIYFNPRTWARERARMHARERQPSVRKLTPPQPFGWPCSATPALSGAAKAATKFATLRNLAHFEMSLRLPSSRLRSFRPAFGGLTRPFGLRWKGAAKLQPSSLRETANLSNAAIAASIWIHLQNLLIRARLAIFVAFSLVQRESKTLRGFAIWSTAYGLSGLRPAPELSGV